MKRGRIALLALASIAFATVVVMPALVALRTSPGFPVQAFTVDDGLYLQRAIGAWKGEDPYEWTYYENARTRPLGEVALGRPNAVVDIAVGAVASGLDLSASELAVLLDWTFGALSFALFVAIFLLWTDAWTAIAAAILAVCWCELLIPDAHLLLPNAALPWAVNQPFVDHAEPPLRAVYTQVGYPLFLAGLFLLLRRFVNGTMSAGAMFAIGVLGGLNGFGYFFPWLVALAVGMSLPVVGAVLRAQPLVRIAAGSSAFLSGWIAGSAGVLYITLKNQTTGIIGGDVLGRYWWLPVEHLFFAMVLVFLAVRDRTPRRTLLAFVGLAFALELPLMNVQTVLRQGIAPYHFVSFYLHPLVTGGLFVLLVDWLRRSMSMHLVATAVCALPVLAFGFDYALRTRAALTPIPIAEDLGWLIGRLQEEPSDSVFAMNPVEHPYTPVPENEFVLRNLPNFVATMSQRYTLHQEWMFNEIADDSDLRRELGVSWLLSGTTRPLWEVRQPVRLPGDLFTLTTTYFELRRVAKIEAHGTLVSSYTPCRFVSDFRVDLFVHDKENDGAMAPAADRFLTLEGTSPHGGFDLYRFDRERARRELCAGGAPA